MRPESSIGLKIGWQETVLDEEISSQISGDDLVFQFCFL